MMSILLIVLTLACVAAWFFTKKAGWALLTAVFVFLIAKQFIDVSDWVEYPFWGLILFALVAMFFISRLFLRIAITALVVAALVLVIGGLWNAASHQAKAATITQDLTVHPGDLVPAAAACTSDEFNNNSLSTTRKWSDADSTPFKASAKDAMLQELLAENCQNPTLGDAYAQALNDAVIGDFRVGAANPWLGQFLARANNPGLRSAYLIKKAGSKSELYVTKDYQEKAQLVNMLLLKLANQGVVAGQTSTANWPLVSMVAGELPRSHKVTDPKKQENLPFLALAYTTKASLGPCATYVLGVNTMDKRPENFGCAEATKIPPKQPTTPIVTTTTPAPRTTVPSTTPPTTPPMTPPTSHTCPPGTFMSEKYGCLTNKVNQTAVAPPAKRSPAGPPQGPRENKPPVQPSPANPTDKPGSGSSLPAPGASSVPSHSVPAPTPTSVAPSSSSPGATIPDPTG